jgi:hypothetical protein
LESLLFLDEHPTAIYLLDLGLENIAYNEVEERVVFIDAEHLLVVDKLEIAKENNNNESSYFMKFDDCNGDNTDCLSFSVDSMCTSLHVDINFYSGLTFTFLLCNS